MGKEYNVTITIVSKLTLCIEAENSLEAEKDMIKLVTENPPPLDFDPENIIMVISKEEPDGNQRS